MPGMTGTAGSMATVGFRTVLKALLSLFPPGQFSAERQAWEGGDEYSWLSWLLLERTWGNQGFCKSMSGPESITNPVSWGNRRK